MLSKSKTVISHVFTIALILWVISLVAPTTLFFKVWTGAAVLAACLVLSYGVKPFLKWFLLTIATIFCIVSIWIEPISLVFTIWLSAGLSLIYFHMATGGKYVRKYRAFKDDEQVSGTLYTSHCMDYGDDAWIVSSD